MKKFLQKTARVLDQPKVLLGKALGVQQTFCFYCLSIKEFFPDIKTIFDVGSAQGDFTKACKFVFPKSIIHTFEPISQCYDQLKDKNYPNVKCYNFGLWDKSQDIIFNYNPNYLGVSSFLKRTKLHNDTFEFHMDEEEIKTKVKRFDDLNIKIERPCLLKIDCEGGDFNVLKGFGERLNEVDIIQIEWFFHNYYDGMPKLSEVISYLESFGFTIFVQKAVQKDKDGKLLYCDLIFIRGDTK